MTENSYKSLAEYFEKHKALIKAMDIIDKIIVVYAVVAYLGFLVMCVINHVSAVLYYFACPAVSFVFVSLFRRLFDMKRPYEVYDIKPLIGKGKQGQSFPSRHVFSIVIIAVTLWQLSLPLGIITTVAAVILAAIRVVTGVHFVRDVLAGALIAVICGILGYIVLI